MTRHHTSVIIIPRLPSSALTAASHRRVDMIAASHARAAPALKSLIARRVSSARRATSTTTRAAAPFEVPAQYTSVVPCGAGVLVKVAAAEAVTKGGIVLTESAQRKPTSGA
jgi:chaperonin GroES|tara:strand:+ start:231 stop:566 length:336 start_codon:yes stop_codon:yes gene_type:complete